MAYEREMDTAIELARKAGAIPVSYGTRVLRVETAAIFGLCVLAYELAGL